MMNILSPRLIISTVPYLIISAAASEGPLPSPDVHSDFRSMRDRCSSMQCVSIFHSIGTKIVPKDRRSSSWFEFKPFNIPTIIIFTFQCSTKFLAFRSLGIGEDCRAAGTVSNKVNKERTYSISV